MNLVQQVCDELNKISIDKCGHEFFKVSNTHSIILTSQKFANSLLTRHLWDILKLVEECKHGYVRLNYEGKQISISGTWPKFAEELGCTPTYSVGDRFYPEDQSYRDLMLCKIEAKQVVLIDMNTGEKWGDRNLVSDINAITQNELNVLSNGYKLIKK